MNKKEIIIKRLLLFLLFSTLLLSSVYPSSADFLEETQVGVDPKGDANPASVDVLEVFITNNGTHFIFIIKCRATPAPSLIRSYVVWLDTKGDSAPDYCLVAGDRSSYPNLVPTVVSIKDTSIYLMARLEDIEYPDGVEKDPVNIVVTTQQPPSKVRDRAPDSGTYQVRHAVISELPGIVLFIFVPSVLFTIYMIYRRRFRGEG